MKIEKTIELEIGDQVWINEKGSTSLWWVEQCEPLNREQSTQLCTVSSVWFPPVDGRVVLLKVIDENPGAEPVACLITKEPE